MDRSRWAYDGPLGFGWTHNHDQKLLFDPADGPPCDSDPSVVHTVLWVSGDGGVLTFVPSGTGWHSIPDSEYLLLRATTEKQWKLVAPDGVTSTFDEDGLLRGVEDLNENKMTYFWTERGLRDGSREPAIDYITDTLGREVRFHYDGAGYLDSVRIPSLGIVARYEVNADQDLEHVISADGFAERYEYLSNFRSTEETYVPTVTLRSYCESSCQESTACSNRGPFCREQARAFVESCTDRCFDPAKCERNCSECVTTCAGEPALASCRAACEGPCDQECSVWALPQCTAKLLEAMRACPLGCTRGAWHYCADTLACIHTAVEGVAIIPTKIWDDEICYGLQSCSREAAGREPDGTGDALDVPFPEEYSTIEAFERMCVTPGSGTVSNACLDLDGNGVLGLGWNCRDECFTCFYNGQSCPDGSAAEGRDCPDVCRQRVAEIFELSHCVNDYQAACGTSCDQACEQVCRESCEVPCTTACKKDCNDRKGCSDQCLTHESEFVSACEEGCVDTCVTALAHPSGRVTFGRVDDLNHNLWRIYDGRGQLYVENHYGQDIFEPNFDRVFQQTFGKTIVELQNYDLGLISALEREGYAIPAELRPPSDLVETHPTAVSVCPSCSHVISRPRSTKYVKIEQGDYVAIQGVTTRENVTGEGWSVNGDLSGLAAYRWLEVYADGEARGTGGANLGAISPPVRVDKVTVQSPHGTLVFGGDPEHFGRVRFDGSDARVISNLGDGRSGLLVTLVRGPTGWEAYPGVVRAAVRLSPADSCSEVFSVSDLGDGERLALSEGACSGSFQAREIGRRSPPAQGGLLPDYDDPLSDPAWAMSWLGLGSKLTFDRPHPTGRSPSSAALGANRWRGRDACIPATPVPPEPECTQAVERMFPHGGRSSGGPSGGRPSDGRPSDGWTPPGGVREEFVPDCSAPWMSRPAAGGRANGSGSRSGPSRVGGDPGPGFEPPMGSLNLGCHPPITDPPIVVEHTCETRFLEPVQGAPFAFQPITQATLVRDGTEAIWVYYSDRAGRILRIVNATTGSTMDRNFDANGRFLGERHRDGSRTCVERDAQGQVILAADLPANRAFAAQKALIRELHWSEYGRLGAMSRVNALGQAVAIHTYDAKGNIDRTDFAGGDYLDYTVDPQGRIRRIDTPRGATTLTYDPVSGQANAMTLDEGGRAARTISFPRSPDGRIRNTTQPGGPSVDVGSLKDGRPDWARMTVDFGNGPTTLSTDYSYRPDGLLESIVGPEITTHYSYDLRGLLRSRKDAGSNGEERTSCFGYDGRGDLVAVIDPEGRQTRLERNTHGEVIKVERGVFAPEPAAWDDDCAQNVTDGAGHDAEVFLRLERDRAGRVHYRYVGPSGGAGLLEGGPGAQDVELVYDGYGRIIEEIGTDGSSRRFGYDAEDRVIWEASYFAGAPAYVSALDARGMPNDALPELASLTLRSYDDLGRPTRVRRRWFVDDGPRQDLGQGDQRGWSTFTAEYNDVLGTVTVHAPDGRTSVDVLDFFGRVASRVEDDGSSRRTSTFEWSPDARTLVRTEAPATTETHQRISTFRFSPLGTLVAIEDGTGETLYRVDLDGFGRPARTFDRMTRRQIAYDSFGTLKSVERIDSNGIVHPYVTHELNRNGVVRALIDGRGRRWDWSFDAQGRVHGLVHPDGTSDTFLYWPGSQNVHFRTDRQGDVLTYEYGAFGEVRRVVGTNQGATAPWSMESEIGFDYDVLGLRHASSKNNPSDPHDDVEIEYVRDSLGQPVRIENAQLSEATSLGRDALGRPTEIRFGAKTIHRAYDGFGRLRMTTFAIGAQPPKGIAELEYNGFGAAHRVSFGNGLAEQRAFDEDGRIQSAVIARSGSGASGGNVYAYERFYGTDSTLARVDRQIEGQTKHSQLFSTDSFGRLAGAADHILGLPAMRSGAVTPQEIERQLDRVSTGRESFTYDEADNFRRVESPHGNAAPVIGADDRYLAFDSTIESDPTGRTTLQGSAQFRYDSLGRLMERIEGSAVWRFRYDAFGQLAGWVDASGKDEDVRRAEGWIVEIQTTEASSAHFRTAYVPGASFSPLATVNQQNDDVVFHHSMWGERISASSDERGHIVEQYDWSAYGTPTILGPSGDGFGESAVGNRLLIAGGLHFPELGLHDFGQRWYSPKTGRFLSQDPLGFYDGPNPYLYAGAHPVEFIDPLGLAKRKQDLAELRADACASQAYFKAHHKLDVITMKEMVFLLKLQLTLPVLLAAGWAAPVETGLGLVIGNEVAEGTENVLVVSGVEDEVVKELIHDAAGLISGFGTGRLLRANAFSPTTEATAAEAGRLSIVPEPAGRLSTLPESGNLGTAAAKGGQKLLPANAGPTAHISPSEVAGKTPAQIDARARQLGLQPRGPDPAGGRGAYVDPQTGQQRILSHPNASPPHGHVNNPAGQRIGPNGEVVPPESPAAHLPIKFP